MKKLVSLALSAALTLSSMSAFALSFGGNDNLPETVDIKLDAKIAQDTTYGDYATPEDALTIKTSSGSATINAEARIDMTAVAEAWFAYIAAGESYVEGTILEGFDVVELVDLSQSRFTVTIETDDEITHEDILTKELGWCTDTKTYFAQDGEVKYVADGDKHVFTVTMKPIASNADFNEYFTKVLDPDADEQYLKLSIDGSKVEGSYGVEYEIVSKYEGEIVIGLPGSVSGGGTSAFVVDFADEDTNYVELARTGGGGGVRPTAKPTEAPTEAPTVEPTATPVPTVIPVDPSVPAPTVVPEIPVDTTPQIGGTSVGAKLNYNDHFAYIIGDDPAEDGSVAVRPMDNITRAEVATIFYRLLEHESRELFRTEENHFSDVNEDDWFNNAISTVVAAGIFEGYDDGTFAPNKPITRAEFAIIASRFSSLEYDGGPLFTDIVGHWAEESINRAAVTGWINGYDDRSFRPDNMITRAEAITLINRVLYRIVHEDGHLDDGHIDFTDNDISAWYYGAILEASNSHDYDREAIGYPEIHTELTDNIDWDSHQ